VIDKLTYSFIYKLRNYTLSTLLDRIVLQ